MAGRVRVDGAPVPFTPVSESGGVLVTDDPMLAGKLREQVGKTLKLAEITVEEYERLKKKPFVKIRSSGGEFKPTLFDTERFQPGPAPVAAVAAVESAPAVPDAPDSPVMAASKPMTVPSSSINPP